MTTEQSEVTRSRIATATGSANREPYVDSFRGLLIAHMALDHASLMFNAGRGGEELAALAPDFPSDIWQFLTRFTGIPVAPAFCFMAGFMVAMTSLARVTRGISHGEVTRRLIIRGLVLIAADAIIMGLPRALMGFYSFMVLSSIGVAIIVLALIRDVPTKILLPASLAILLLHPLIDVSGLPIELRAILYEPVREGAVRSMYPIIPWGALVVLGFVVGRDAVTRTNPIRFWLRIGAMCFAVFFAVRLYANYGNAFEYTSVTSRDFWFFAKYPPDLPFLTWALAITFVTLAALKFITRDRTPSLLKPLEVFGRVPFFFYLLHFYVLGVAQALIGT
ncbi:MAG TPA: heparan-alpha-glucosaminide N-acetyltransferase domain-containing protein, partial [Steroidobacteraceae bacterium]|nr:heparan-alpha-glucosaminide N-acetyltransferase domain-containing protein [Steroidobacteraceae bacterium]